MVLDRENNPNLLVINNDIELPFYSYQEILDFNTSLVSYQIVIRIQPTDDFLVELYTLFNGSANFVKSVKIYDGVRTLVRDITKDFTLEEAFVETFRDFNQKEFVHGNIKLSYKLLPETEN